MAVSNVLQQERRWKDSRDLIVLFQNVAQLLKVQQLVTTKVDGVILQTPTFGFQREKVADLSEQLGRGGGSIDLPQHLGRRQLVPQHLQSYPHCDDFGQVTVAVMRKVGSGHGGVCFAYLHPSSQAAN